MESLTFSPTALRRLVESLGDCLTEETARRLLALKADRKLQQRIDRLARKNQQGKLTPEEREELRSYVSFGTFVSILKSKARQQLAKSATP